MKDLLDKKTNSELMQSIIAELAKAQNEIRCAQGDLEKAQNRLKFALAVQHILINRKEDK